jgi:hypothetical protein
VRPRRSSPRIRPGAKLSETSPATPIRRRVLGRLASCFSQPILQITASGSSTAAVGHLRNDYATVSGWGKKPRRAIIEGVRRIADQLQAEGYRGVLASISWWTGMSAHHRSESAPGGLHTGLHQAPAERGRDALSAPHLLAFLASISPGPARGTAGRFRIFPAHPAQQRAHAQAGGADARERIYAWAPAGSNCAGGPISAPDSCAGRVLLECAPRGALIDPTWNMQSPAALWYNGDERKLPEGFLM